MLQFVIPWGAGDATCGTGEEAGAGAPAGGVPAFNFAKQCKNATNSNRYTG